MTSAVTIYHNPHYLKSREMLSLLQSRDIDPQVVLHLDAPPDVDMLRELLQLLSVESPHGLIHQKEDLYKSLSLTDQALSDAALIQATVSNPKLIKRPIIVNRDQARIDHPPEQIPEIISQPTCAALSRHFFLRGRFQIFHTSPSRPPDDAAVHLSLNPLDG